MRDSTTSAFAQTLPWSTVMDTHEQSTSKPPLQLQLGGLQELLSPAGSGFPPGRRWFSASGQPWTSTLPELLLQGHEELCLDHLSLQVFELRVSMHPFIVKHLSEQ